MQHRHDRHSAWCATGFCALGFCVLRLCAIALASWLCLAPATEVFAADGALADPSVQAPSLCPQKGTDHAVVARINERLEIILKDGRTLRLAGVEAPRPTPTTPDLDTSAHDTLSGQMSGDIAFIPLADRPDRWGRIPAFVFFAARPSGNFVSAAEFVLAAGFGRYMPEPEAHLCRSQYLAVESQARTAKLGLWRDPYYAVIAATDRPAFAEKAATNVLVEGRLISVDRGPARIYLEFAPRREHAFEVTILQRNVKIFDRAGLDFRTTIGDILRVRGLLDMRFGPQIEISNADEIELIPEAGKGRAMGQDSDVRNAGVEAATPAEKSR